MMEFMSSFPRMYKTDPNNECLPGGQKVVCTPEVSLYQYSSSEMGPGPPSSRLDDKVITADLEVGGSVNGSTGSSGGFQCGFCGKTFQQKNTFQNHLRSHREGEDPYQCDICGKTFAVPARLTRHYRTHTGEKPYQCEYCNKSFSVKENLSVHRRIHTKERPYKCEVCERAFEHSGKLHRHMRIHTGERPHRCQICQKTFIQSGQLVIHMRTHTGEKPYVCKVCNKGFTCSKQLKVHTRTHTGEKPYTCDICGKSFGYNHVLKLHQVAHYGEKVYKCTLCNGTFNSKKALETHIKTHSDTGNPTSPAILPDPCAMSPVSISQTPPQHSDKENRESSDSEVSSQNSPTLDAPKTPPSPSSAPYPHYKPNIHLHPQIHHHPGNHGSSGSHYHGNSSTGTNSSSSVFPNQHNHGSNVNNNSAIPNIPHQMLPPGVQVHQAPQSRTTFLYVTSKLPPHINNGSTHSSGLSNSSTNNMEQANSSRVQGSQSTSSFKFGLSGVLSKSSGLLDSAREKQLILRSASLTDQVLAFTEQFGYGIPPKLGMNSPTNGNSSQSSCSPVRRFDERRERSNMAVSDNLLISNYGRQGYVGPNRCDKNDGATRSYTARSRSKEAGKERSVSPDNVQTTHSSMSTYTPGGVLALALTRGSKIANQLSNLPSMPLRAVTPPNSNPESPELCIDFSRRSVSPGNNGSSPTPSTTPRSTPGLSESPEDLSDEYVQGLGPRSPESGSSGYSGSVSSKRTRSSSSSGGCGPRKRSSLILEKYAQENPGTPTPSNESILSQRLRLSSVIQYAEKCT